MTSPLRSSSICRIGGAAGETSAPGARDAPEAMIVATTAVRIIWASIARERVRISSKPVKADLCFIGGEIGVVAGGVDRYIAGGFIYVKIVGGYSLAENEKRTFRV